MTNRQLYTERVNSLTKRKVKLMALLFAAALLTVGCGAQTGSSTPPVSSSPSGSSPAEPDAEFTAYRLHQGRKVGFVDAKTADADAAMTALFEQIFADMQRRTDAPLAIDIFALEEIFAVRKTVLPNGEITNAYVFMLDKKPVVQDGRQGRVSPLKSEHFDALAKLFEQKGSIRYIRADSQNEQSFGYVMSQSENEETMLISSLQHLPVIRFDDAKKLREFIRGGSELFNFDAGYFGEVSLLKAVEDYTEDFFENRVLFAVYAEEGSGSNRHSVESISIDEGKLTFEVGRIQPEIGTTDMANWFIFIELEKTSISDIDQADAYILPTAR